jgi:hypothetical protein
MSEMDAMMKRLAGKIVLWDKVAFALVLSSSVW